MFDSQSNLSSRSTGRSEGSANSYLKENWELPNERISYISTHNATQIAKLHDHSNMLKPVWTKVTKTPWQGRATLCGGYGMRMQIHHASHDAPAQIKLHHTSNMDKPLVYAPRGSLQSLASTKRIVIPCESAHVLPGGASILAATQAAATIAPEKKMGYKTYLYNKQQIFDEVPLVIKPSPLEWSMSAREDFGPSARSRLSASEWGQTNLNRKSPNQSSSGNRSLKSR
jgi:hypothetical protein